MPTLRENAVEAIQMGVEDLLANDPRRAASAARNYFSGILLLAKDALLQAAPGAEEDLLISAKLTLVPDGHGGAEVAASGHATLDFHMLGQRLKAFDVDVNLKALEALQGMRNHIEHSHHSYTAEQVRAAISASFPVVSQLVAAIGEDPFDLLGGDAWTTIVQVTEVFELERKRCEATFAAIDWSIPYMSVVPLLCPDCASPLVAQVDPTNSDPAYIDGKCRTCGESNAGEAIVPYSLKEHFAPEMYSAARYGGEPPLGTCPECALETYISDEEISGCAWCGESLGECAVCGQGLTPENVSAENSKLCSYHGNQGDWDRD